MTEALDTTRGGHLMDSPSASPLVACVNSSEDIVELLATVLQEDGLRAVTHVSPTKEGPQPEIDFLRNVRPQAVIFNVSLPYEASWQEFLQVRAALPDCPFVVTTTNKRALDELVGPTNSIEIIGKPFDLDHIVAVVRRTLAGGH